MAKEIGWYGKKQKPLHSRPGAYRTRAKGLGEGFSWFAGAWGNQAKDPDEALVKWVKNGTLDAEQNKEWCGLAERAK